MLAVVESAEQQTLRRLARDQWVRLHGTPRVTVLVGGGEHARSLWQAWLDVSNLDGRVFEQRDLAAGIRAAIDHAIETPSHPVCVLTSRDALSRWRRGRKDRLSAMVDEGCIEVVAPARQRRVKAAPYLLDARSAAEAALFEALEATPATRGRFRLNEDLSVFFGSRAAEVDLLSRVDAIAIEIDGIHHFADPDCYRRDRRKDLLMQGHGLLVIRLLAEDVMRDPREAVKVVVQGLAFRGKGK